MDLGEQQDDRGSGCLWLLAAGAATALAAALGALLAGRKSLSADEAETVATASRPIGDLLELVVRSDLGQAAHLLALHPVARLEDAEWAVRAPSAAAVALAVGLSYPLGARLFGRVAGLVTALALATSAGAVAVAQLARPYALALLGIVLASLLLVRALDRGSAGRWAAYAVSAAALPLLHPAAAAALGAHVAAAVARGRRDATTIVGIVAGLALAVPVLVVAAVDRADTPSSATELALLDLADGVAAGLGWNLALLAAAPVGVGLAAAGRVPAARPWSAVLAGGLAVAPLGALLVAALALPVHGDRVLVLSLPGLALGAGAAVAALPGRWAVAAAALLAAAAAVTLVLFYASRPAEDWRRAARDVAARRAAGETIVVVPARALAAFAYHAPDVRTWRRAYGDGAWVLVQAGSDAEAITRARLVVGTPRYALAEQRSYGDELRLQHWVRP